MNHQNLPHLNQFFSKIYQFTSARSNQNSVFSEVEQALQKISNNLNQQNKLKVKIFSQFPILSQAFYNFFAVSQPLPQLYNFNIVDLPNGFQPIQPNQSLNPTLTLEANPETGQPEYCQPLNPNKNILIGRDKQKLSQDYRSQNAIVLDLPNYQKVSSIHAEISLKPYSNPPTWQITDLNSKNGTYVNSQKINGTQILNSGDTISLAYDSGSSKAPKFIFNAVSTVAGVNSSSIINDGELIFLIINPQQPFNDQERQLIHQVSQTNICGLIVIPEFSAVNNEQISQQVNANLTALNQWLKSNYPQLDQLAEISPLVLYLFYANPPSPIANPNLKEQYGKFCNNLIKLAQAKSSAVISAQVTQNILMQINRIDQYYQDQAKKIKTENQYMEDNFQGQTIEDIKYQLQIQFRRVNEEREDFFRHSRKQLSDSTTDFLNTFSQRSFINEINNSIQNLDPLITEERGEIRIKLVNNYKQDIHDSIIQKIKTNLGNWTEEEWGQILRKLNYLIDNSYRNLNFLRSFSLANPFNLANQHPNSNKILSDSFVATQNESSFFQNQRLSGQQNMGWGDMAIEASVTFMSAMMGSPYAIIGGIKLAPKFINKIFKPSRTPIDDMNKAQEEKRLNQAIAQLKQVNSNYYQGLTKYLVDRLYKEMSFALENEEIAFKRSLNRVEDQYNAYFRELNKYYKEFNQKQQVLQQEMENFAKIKHLLS